MPCSSVIGDHKTDDDDRDGSEKVTKASTLRACITVSQPAFLALSSLRDYDVKLPNFTFYGGRKHSSWTCIRRLVRNSTPGEFAYTLQNKWVGIIAMKIEKNANSIFKQRVGCRRGPRIFSSLLGKGVQRTDKWIFENFQTYNTSWSCFALSAH